MAQNHFLLPEDEYQRAVNPINDWVKQTALYAHKMTGKPYALCVEHLKKKLRSGDISFKNPTVVYFERGENGDKVKTTCPLTKYLRDIETQGEIQAPTLTSYLHPKVKLSIVAEFLDENVKERSRFKKLSQRHESEGNTNLYKYYHNAQDAAKRANNSVSGGFVAEGSVINNPSGHSTLTSVTRSIASLSNASNERLIEGNRHYATYQIAMNNLISIVAETDSPRIEATVAQFGLVYPSIDDTLACVRRSTDLYWRDRHAWGHLRAFIETLSPAERASIVYTGDLYHLRLHNDAFIRQLITDLAKQGDSTPMENPIGVIWKTDELIVNYVHQINLSLVKGIGKDYAKLDFPTQCILAATCQHVEQMLEKYSTLLRTFFLTKNSPATIATIPNMIRRAVVLSDTDSTMFSVDSWTLWYFDTLRFDDRGYAVSGAVMFIATQAIAHILSLFSANMNVDKSRLHTLAMKPEFVFPVFAQTSVSKHYYTAMMVKEGNVYKDIKMEIKGVHMKDSSVPTNIIKAAAGEMEQIIRTVMDGKPLSLAGLLKRTADIEREILASIYRGETKYLKRIKIKEEKAYAQDASRSPYQYYTLWDQCFSPTYGASTPPPYQAVRIPLDLPNKQAVKTWLDNLPNRGFAQRITHWMVSNNKALLGSLPIPMEHCTSHGVPDELKVILDTRKIVLSLTKAHRNTLESLGYYSKQNLLISEQGY